MTSPRRIAALALVAGLALGLGGCENLVALCNATGAGTPEQCEARWSTCHELEQSCASGDAGSCEAFQRC